MSKAFLKDDLPNEPFIVPPLADLPPGTPNRVTPRGLKLLEEKRAALEAEIERWRAEHAESDPAVPVPAVLYERLNDVQKRIVEAEVAPPPAAPTDVVQFGATVVVEGIGGEFAGERWRFTIVGVDEAAEFWEDDLVAFTAPIAQAVLGRKRGDEVRFSIEGRKQHLRIVGVAYGSDDGS